MKFSTLLLGGFLFGSTIATAALHPLLSISALRHEGQARPAFEITDEPDSAYALAGPLSQLSLEAVPQAASFEEVKEAFRIARDSAVVSDPEHGGMLRRAPWLYPPDGCYVRATLAAQAIEPRAGLFSKLRKIWVFGGNLVVFSPWAPDYQQGVPWGYHVALLMRQGGRAYVLDPALDPSGPLTFESWTSRFVRSPEAAMWSVCSAFTFGPNQSCHAGQWLPPDALVEERTVRDHAQGFLQSEWEAIGAAGFNAQSLLGPSPPWGWPEVGSRSWLRVSIYPPRVVTPARAEVFGQSGAQWVRLHLLKPEFAGGTIQSHETGKTPPDLLHAYDGSTEAWTVPTRGDAATVLVDDNPVNVDMIEISRY